MNQQVSAAKLPTTAAAGAVSRESILAQAMALSPTDRETVADELWRSLDHAGGHAEGESEQQNSMWAAEIDRRVAAIKAGDVQGVDPEDFFRRMREKYTR